LAITRVYILAKELGVKSSAIVKKCQDEGLEIKNHMSVISAGLAATIREWFTEGDNVTTVETSDKVDLTKVRIKKQKKAKKLDVKETEPEEAVEETPAAKLTRAVTVSEIAQGEQERHSGTLRWSRELL
jgi:translation initiation factor IF-2